MSKFSHLHTHSHYSLLQALPKIPDLVKKAKEYDMNALALTDNGNLYGAIEFYKECKKNDIKPIIGVDFYMSARTRFDKEPRIDNKRSRPVLLAKDEVGYKNIIQLVTLSHLEGFYYKPRIDKELLEKYNNGLIAILPSFSGDIAQAVRTSNDEKTKEFIDFYKKIFGDNLYQEITSHDELENHNALMKKIVDLCRLHSIPIVAGQDVYYIDKDDKQARNTLLSIQKSFGARAFEDDDGDFSFFDQKEAQKLFSETPEALLNNQKIVNQCNLELSLGNWTFPHINIESNRTPDEELTFIVEEGYRKREIKKTAELDKRAKYELSVIKAKGYANYFLVVADLLRFAREKKILSNIRGSVSGSLVTFLSGITNINPIEYEIPFERFLNPDRPSAPDIDMDFADDRRDEMVEYAKQKYGIDRVAQIGTFGTMAARGSVRDVARALGYSVATGDRIAKMIPMGSQGFPMTLSRALDENPELNKAYTEEEDTQKIIDMAKKIEGCARHISIHAAGVVISPSKLTDFTALQYDPKGENKIITQYDMYSIDEAGLLKFDFLGLKNLSIIADTIRLIKKLKEISINTDSIPMDDKKTFEMLALGYTTDVFQLNGDGMTRFLVDLKPTTIHDINAMVALYRPGPIQFIPEYIQRKHNPTLIHYLDSALEPILQKTYGILVYQDDLLMMAHKLAGYSWGEVDKFRKAVGKKIPEEMAKQKKQFIDGCIKNSNWSEKKAKEIWGWIEPFAAYGFNKAHSVSYGRIAYITAYLKANFPAEYMASVLTHESGDIEKVAESIKECERMEIRVLPPSVNESFNVFTVIKDLKGKEQIRFGLTSIKNFGEGIGQVIIDEGKKAGKFTNLENFLERIVDRNLNKKSLEALIKAGAMDEFGDRNILLSNIENLLTFNKEHQSKSSDQNSLFGSTLVSRVRLDKAESENLTEKLMWEKELLGLYISGHPLDKIREKMEKKGISIERILNNCKEGQTSLVVGIPEEIKEIKTKKDSLMAFIKIADYNARIEVVLFPKIYLEHKALLRPDACLAIEGTISMRNGNVSLLAEKIREV